MQLLIDLRRIYTYSLKKNSAIRVFEHLVLYEHALQKFFDVIYIVEYFIELHIQYQPWIKKMRVYF